MTGLKNTPLKPHKPTLLRMEIQLSTFTARDKEAHRMHKL